MNQFHCYNHQRVHRIGLPRYLHVVTLDVGFQMDGAACRLYTVYVWQHDNNSANAHWLVATVKIFRWCTIFFPKRYGHLCNTIILHKNQSNIMIKQGIRYNTLVGVICFFSNCVHGNIYEKTLLHNAN